MVLTIQRPGEKKPRKFEITRKQITTPQVTYYGVKNDSIGYIYLKAFTIKSAQEVKEAFLDLKKIIILSLWYWICAVTAAACWKVPYKS